jgi:4-hydroxy-3-methylbut-2-enyl diphosphate reductase
VSQKVADQAELRDLPVIDATRPLVAKVHREGQRYAEKGFDVILIGHEGHPRSKATRGRIPGGVHLVQSGRRRRQAPACAIPTASPTSRRPRSASTTRASSSTRFKERFPNVNGRTCATSATPRRIASRPRAPARPARRDHPLVVGSSNSSTSNRLREIGTEMNVPSYLIDQADDVDPARLKGVKAVGLTAGASAPEELVQQVIARLGEFGPIEVQNLEGVEENVRFKLPEMLWDVAESPYGTTHKYSRRESNAAQ